MKEYEIEMNEFAKAMKEQVAAAKELSRNPSPEAREKFENALAKCVEIYSRFI